MLIAQSGLNLFGIGGDTDIDPDLDVDSIDGGDSLSFLSVRALAGFLTCFGLVGWKGTAAGWGNGSSAFAGFSARVYLRVPAEKSGKGKITVTLQGQSVEFEALTSRPELPTGSECRITKMATESTFEVSPID